MKHQFYFFTRFFIAITAISFLFASCSGSGDDIVENPDANNTTLSNFMFSQSNNEGLASNVTSISNRELIYITAPNEMSLTHAVPTFKVADGASVTINGQPVESGKTEVDISNTSNVVVTSESGLSRTYTLLAKNGISQIDNMVYSFMIKHEIPGVSLSVSKDEEIVYSAGYGFAVKETKQRVTPNTLFRLASMSKQQTALAIMTLYEKGLLTVEDYVFGKGGVLEKEFGTDIHPLVKAIKIKHLLSHTSGWSSDPIYTSESTTLDERIAKYAKTVAPTYSPGTTFDYNNLNFCILGKIIEVLSGKDYETFLKEEVHSKAGIENIFVGKNSLGERRENECQYYGQDGKNPYANDMELSKAAGGMIASTPELMKLMSYIDYGTKVPDMLKRETLDLMYTPLDNITEPDGDPWNRYALGWRTNYPYISDWTTYHGGTLAGVCTIWARGKKGVNGTILCNSRSYGQSIDDDMWYMLEDIQKMF